MTTGKTWVWRPYSRQRGHAFVTELRGLGNDGARRLLKGERFASAPRLVATGVEPGRFVDNLGAYIGVHLLTLVLADVLRGFEHAELQLLPVTIKSEPELSYFALNVLGSVALLDREHSRFSTFAGTDRIERVTRLKLRPLPASAPPIFHLAEHPVLILVNDEVCRALQAASRNPGVLTPAEKWRNEY
jgi:hypothetical protein